MANKLYQLSYISEIIEKFATNMLLSAVEQSPSGTEHSQSGPTGQRAERMVCIFQLLLLFPFLSMQLQPTMRILHGESFAFESPLMF